MRYIQDHIHMAGTVVVCGMMFFYLLLSLGLLVSLPVTCYTDLFFFFDLPLQTLGHQFIPAYSSSPCIQILWGTLIKFCISSSSVGGVMGRRLAFFTPVKLTFTASTKTDPWLHSPSPQTLLLSTQFSWTGSTHTEKEDICLPGDPNFSEWDRQALVFPDPLSHFLLAAKARLFLTPHGSRLAYLSHFGSPTGHALPYSLTGQAGLDCCHFCWGSPMHFWGWKETTSVL